MTAITDLKDQAGDFLGSEDFKKIMPYLLSGGAGAAVGGVMSGRRRKENGEGRVGYMGRILRNALMAGGLAGGSHYLLGKGLDKTLGSIDGQHVRTGKGEDSGPLASTVKNVSFSPLTAAAAGGAGLVMTHGNELIGAGNAGKASNLKALAKQLKGMDVDVLKSKNVNEIADLVPDHLEDTRRAAGLASSKIGPGQEFLKSIPGLTPEKAEKLKGYLSTIGRKGMSTFGQSHTRRAGRGALGLAAAGVPALAGAFMTDHET